jgi:hypothetical protein
VWRVDKRCVAERILLAAGVLAVALGLLVAYVYDTMSDGQEFADRATIVYSSPVVREQITNAVVDQIVGAEPDLVAVQPLLASIVSGVLASESTTKIVRATVVDLHRTVIGEQDDTVTMQFVDLILIAKTQLSALDAEAGALIPDDLTDAIVEVSAEPVFVDVVQTIDDLWVIAMLLPVLGALAFVASIWLAPSGSSGLVRVGSALVGAGFLAALLEWVGRRLVIGGDGGEPDVAGIVWDAFVVDFATWAVATAAFGAVLAAAAWFGVGEVEPGRLSDRIGPVIGRRTSKTGRVVWGLGAVAVGVVFIMQWQLVMQFSIAVVGAALVAVGLREALTVVAPGLVHRASATDLGSHDDERRRHEPSRPQRGRWAAMAVLVMVGVVAAAAVALSGGSSEGPSSSGCNGKRRFCDRRLDEMVLPATHNSHAAADEGFLLGYQRAGIASQLDGGVRALLIDVYFGRVVDGLVFTDRAPLSDDERADLVLHVGEGAVKSAEATMARVDETGVDSELFLCHALCEIGASRFDVELGSIARFLDDQPGEVLVLIIQDEGPRPDDIADAFEAAGLIDQLHAQPLDEPWPTLGELIDADTRIVVFAENVAGGGFDWYHDAFTYTQDTPFSFETLDDFSCDLNRGDADNSLFLMNHWLTPGSPTAAQSANDAGVIAERFAECADQRGQVPNLIAVDFYSVGDLVETVAELNDG